ncbi:uncharacterized protein Dana_GF16002 [Drosophila ananassae]|uniref:FAD-binding FR-type domain-containing protein n=1 Tax=Drosophila ananassae TaxID=7217 RepID=B3N153_DROAN|nr:NADH-cytochrome b5 reductase-like [Drosophila ananassae]EDV30088.1 uncharacterized protein Dana_GF16002 [Drosophila ananassae]
MVTEEQDLKKETSASEEQDPFTIQESDCCCNGCTNCILDNKPKPSRRLVLAGKRNAILGYTKFRLIWRESHPADDAVLLLHLRHAVDEKDDESVLDIPPGHHVMLRDGSLLRPYSPYWSDFLTKEFRILVKLQPGGGMSRKLASVQVNDVLEFRGPIGNYLYDGSVAKCLFIICQGVAIAPTLPLVRQVLENEDDMSRIWHLVCSRDLQHVYFRDELLEFARNWNYKSCLYLPHQQCGSSACQEAGHCLPECLELAKSLRYKEAAKASRLDLPELSGYANRNIPGTRIAIIAGDSRFQEIMKKMATKALDLEAANVYLL